MCEMNKIFKIIYILVFCLMVILTGLFIYTCIVLKIVQDCQVIGFESKVCEKWRDY